MKNKLTLFILSILLLLAVASQGYSKETQKDKSETITKKNPIEKVTKVQIDDIKKSAVVKNTTPITNTNQTIQDIKAAIDSLPKTSSSMSGEKIDWQVISSGGTHGTSTNFIMSGTIGQTAVGFSSSTNFQLNAGFWQVFGPVGCCIADRGNVDGGPDNGTFPGSVDISDLVYLVSFMFQVGSAPTCLEEANIDASITIPAIDISDLVGLVAFMFQGGATPQPC